MRRDVTTVIGDSSNFRAGLPTVTSVLLGMTLLAERRARATADHDPTS